MYVVFVCHSLKLLSQWVMVSVCVVHVLDLITGLLSHLFIPHVSFYLNYKIVDLFLINEDYKM